MKCLPVIAFGLTRASTGLTDAHTQLIRMLAEIAVEDYLRESDAETATDQQESGLR